jgi:hypothetical protein
MLADHQRTVNTAGLTSLLPLATSCRARSSAGTAGVRRSHVGEAPELEWLLAADRDLDDRQRTTALDVATVVGPRTTRCFAAVAVLTLAEDKRIADAVRDLADRVGKLVEQIAAKEKEYSKPASKSESAQRVPRRRRPARSLGQDHQSLGYEHYDVRLPGSGGLRLPRWPRQISCEASCQGRRVSAVSLYPVASGLQLGLQRRSSSCSFPLFEQG